METLWPDSFDLQEETMSPKEIIEKQLEYLPELTHKTVYGELRELKNQEQDFGYELVLRSANLESYSFRVMRLLHSITLYPVNIPNIYFDPDIREELKKHHQENYADGLVSSDLKIGSQEEFLAFLRGVFHSEKIRKVIGSLIKLSK